VQLVVVPVQARDAAEVDNSGDCTADAGLSGEPQEI
jgi:hypothetical protein